MSPIGPRGENICFGQEISDGQTDVRTDEWMDRHTDHFWAPAEQGPNKSNSFWNLKKGGRGNVRKGEQDQQNWEKETHLMHDCMLSYIPLHNCEHFDEAAYISLSV